MSAYGFTFFWITFLGVVFFIILFLLENGFFSMLKMKPINILDNLNILSFFSGILYCISICLLKELYLYKKCTLKLILAINLIYCLMRIWQYSKAKEQSEDYESNVIDLKELYNGEIQNLNKKPIILEEKDVDYDLLNRTSIIEYLYNSIVLTNPTGKFVISVEGSWGSGKTTIINNVKKIIRKNNKNIIIIDDFDPWIYGDENFLLENMLNLIIKKSGYKYSNLSIRKTIKSLAEVILGTNNTRLLKSIFDESDIIKVKKQINDYLKFSGKKFVFFIDNIDRAEKENVILLFKLVGNVLDFERITYVLSFDNKRVEKIFREDLKIDYEYINKIINLKIYIPEIDKNVLNEIYKKSLKNLLVIYDENIENMDDFNVFVDFICNKGMNIREFKRFVNSSINFIFKTRHYLYNRDLIIMEYIKMFNYSLYRTIYDNRKYFISYDKMQETDIYLDTFDGSKFNKEGKKFFDVLFSKSDNKSYKCLLGIIFPYVDKYNKDEDLIYTGNVIPIDPNYKIISKNRNICSGKYFDLYFTSTNNIHTLIGNMAESFIEKINENNLSEENEELLKNILSKIDTSYQKDFFVIIQLNTDSLNSEIIYNFVNLLLNNIDKIDNSSSPFSLKATDRVALIIYNLLNKISDKEYINFLQLNDKRYNRLNFLMDILYWFEKDRESINVEGRKEMLKELIDKIAANIIESNINLYDDNYIEKNILALYRIYKDNQNVVKEYIKTNVNEKNIFRFLNDMIGESISIAPSSSYTYYIVRLYFEFFTNKNDVDFILNNIEAKTNDEKFVFEVYMNYNPESNIDSSENGIETKQSIKLKL